MLNLKRILIYLTALAGCFALLAVYVVFVGGDTLPPLPAMFMPRQADAAIEEKGPAMGENELRIRQAFGNESKEIERKSKVWSASKGVVLAFDTFTKEDDGRVRFAPFSAAIFPKDKAPKAFPEINIVQCEYALVTFDQPIGSLAELSRRKVIAVELGGRGGVKLANNRRTLANNDDLELRIRDGGKLYYEEARNLIWTESHIQLLDTQSKPRPTEITAQGMEILLAKDASINAPPKDKGAKPAPAAKAPDASPFGGIERVTLKSNVDMHLHVDNGSAFMNPGADATKKPKAGTEEKSHIHVKTNGKFVYELTKEHARFDAPEANGQLADRVTVTRHLGGAPRVDTLVCDQFDLHFRKKAANEPGAGGKEIDFAIALAKPGQFVDLKVESEEMQAFGSEMRYYRADLNHGPRTILKGSPVRAMRQGHQIECGELHLTAATKDGEGQEVFAKGPGKIDLFDKQTGEYSTHIFWKETLISNKMRDGNRVLTLITLRGNAVVIDDERASELRAGQFLHLWIEEVPVITVAKNGDREKSTRQRLYKMEAFENVSAGSPEFILRQAKQFNVIFTEVKPPSAAPIQVGKAPDIPAQLVNRNDPPDGIIPPPVPKAPTAPDPKKPRKPIELTAGDVTAFVNMIEAKKELAVLTAHVNVHVHQDAEDPKEKGLDITGETLELNRFPEGDRLHVIGEARKPAQLRSGETHLFGPIVVINQKENTAEVKGTGALHMPSKKSLDGKQKESYITIHWNEQMTLQGMHAEFKGGVEALQENGKMRCQEMQVAFDKPINFKPGAKDEKPAIDQILCTVKRADQSVYLIDEERDEANRLMSYKRMQIASLASNNKEQSFNGSGPGRLDLITRSSQEVEAEKNGPKQAVRKEEILKWTRVYFEGRILSKPTSADGRRTTFHDQVRVFHQPGDDPNARDPVAIVKGGLAMTCQVLDIVSWKVGPKTTQLMTAHGGNGLVNFQTDEFTGHAKTVKVDDGQDIIVFEGVPGAPATIFQMAKVKGGNARPIIGMKLLYNRKTGEIFFDGVRAISSWNWTIPAADSWLQALIVIRREDCFSATLPWSCSLRKLGHFVGERGT